MNEGTCMHLGVVARRISLPPRKCKRDHEFTGRRCQECDRMRKLRYWYAALLLRYLEAGK